MRDEGHSARQVVWEVLAQFWVDTWYDTKQLDGFADRLVASGLSLGDLDRIAYREVCGAFALFTLAVFLSMGMALPEWYYQEDRARVKIESWLSRPKFLSILNPIWLIGYVAACAFLRASWGGLRGRVALRLAHAA